MRGFYNVGSCLVNLVKIFYIFFWVLLVRSYIEEYFYKEMIFLLRFYGKNFVCSILYIGVIE